MRWTACRCSSRRSELSNVEPFKTVISGDREAIAKLPRKTSRRSSPPTLSGMTIDQFQAEVHKWLATAKHPRWDRPYTELVYEPMLEVLRYLGKRLQDYIVTGGGQDFCASTQSEVYGIPPEQVVGTRATRQFGYDADGRPTLTKEPKLVLNDNYSGKPEGIQMMIGRRPYAAFGNSTGDQQMLEYAESRGRRASDDAGAARRRDARICLRSGQGLPDTKVGTFTQALYDEAKKNGWVVISMKNDWKRIFGFE